MQKMQTKPVEECVGTILCQDITRIVPGEYKGVLFKKGHVIEEEDIAKLLNVGKEHLYVLETETDDVHENNAALRLAQATTGKNILYTAPEEGKTSLVSLIRGLFTIERELLYRMNSIDYVTVSSLPNYFPVESGEKVVGARVVPLIVDEQTMQEAEKIAAEAPDKVFNIIPYKPLKCGIITTGSEIYKGRIKDAFGPVMKEKIEYYGGDFVEQVFCPDDLNMIVEAIEKFKKEGMEFIVLTGGMSVDPDDLTPGAIQKSGAEIITYGAPVQPGNMLMMGYLDDIPILGLPGCAMYSKTTIFDIILPRIFTGIKLTKGDFVQMGEGGLCHQCEVCHYPICYFGRN